MSYQTDILEACQDYGLVLGKTLKEYAGWRTRGSSIFSPKGSVNHHTAGPRTGDLPTLNTLIFGRSDLPGPLCNAALSRSGVIHLIAAGRANHAGLGGWAGLSGNSSVWGLEVEHCGYPDEAVSAARWDAMYRWHRACMDVSGFSSRFVCQHFEWAPTRKIDFCKPLIPNPSLFRDKVAEIKKPSPTPDPQEDDDDMPKPMLLRLSSKDPAVLYMSSARTIHWVRSRDALKGYQLDMQMNGLSPDVCVLNASASDQNLASLYDFVLNLPYIGSQAPNHSALWKGPVLA